ncbi:MAG: alpha/beta hydrolase [Dehalococcoidia bacterium]|jgi:pimeloyl-ACP methyl ester carboxylesterase|nr:alpha/beta hydrolase [Dehalococcoidia bacterium]
MATLYEAARSLEVPFSEEFDFSQRELETPELTLRYLEWGSRESPALVLLHGFAQTAHSWDFIALSLADRYHVVSLDARGHGDSDWSADAAYSATDHRRDVRALVRHLDSPPVTLIGLSMGGGTAYTYTARRSTDVRSLVIVDTGPIGNPAGRRRISNFATLPDELDTLEEFVERIHAYVPERSLEQVRSTVTNSVRQNEAGRWTWKYDSALRDPNRSRKGVPEAQAWSDLKSIHCPTLLIRGAESDVLQPETAVEMERVMQDCTLATIENARHLVPGDNPAGFIRAVGPWLDRVHGI